MNFKHNVNLYNLIAIIAAATVCLTTTGLVLILHKTYWFAVVGILIQFGALFFVFRFLVVFFVEDRIKLIYKMIYTKKKSRDYFLKKHREKGLLSVEQEVEDWLQKREIELEEMKKQATYRREFLGNVSHELKTPVFNIQGYISTLLDGAIDDREVNRNYLERSEANIERMISIITDLETISRLENNQIVPQCVDFDIEQLIREIFNDFEMKAKKHRVNLLFHNKTQSTPMVHADNNQMKQVITNLVENSIRYCCENEPYTKITVYNLYEKILVEVSDNGIGIAENDIPRLFERFYRTDKARSRDKGGTGLGLSIVKHIIEAHQQNITVRSAVGAGSTFTFTIDKANSLINKS